MEILILLVGWGTSMFVLYVVHSAAVRNGVEPLLREQRATNDLLLAQAKLLGHLVAASPAATMTATAPATAAPETTGDAPAAPAAQITDPIEAATLLRRAQDHHFERQFAQARALYAEIVDKFPGSKQAAAATTQLANLKSAH